MGPAARSFAASSLTAASPDEVEEGFLALESVGHGGRLIAPKRRSVCHNIKSCLATSGENEFGSICGTLMRCRSPVKGFVGPL